MTTLLLGASLATIIVVLSCTKSVQKEEPQQDWQQAKIQYFDRGKESFYRADAYKHTDLGKAMELWIDCIGNMEIFMETVKGVPAANSYISQARESIGKAHLGIGRWYYLETAVRKKSGLTIEMREYLLDQAMSRISDAELFVRDSGIPKTRTRIAQEKKVIQLFRDYEKKYKAIDFHENYTICESDPSCISRTAEKYSELRSKLEELSSREYLADICENMVSVLQSEANKVRMIEVAKTKPKQVVESAKGSYKQRIITKRKTDLTNRPPSPSCPGIDLGQFTHNGVEGTMLLVSNSPPTRWEGSPGIVRSTDLSRGESRTFCMTVADYGDVWIYISPGYDLDAPGFMLEKGTLYSYEGDPTKFARYKKNRITPGTSLSIRIKRRPKTPYQDSPNDFIFIFKLYPR